MKEISDALIFAVSYINNRNIEDSESWSDDDDVGALESIAELLSNATPAEEDALAAAAQRALARELAAPQPRPEFVEVYSRWMEDMFGEGWHGNRRVPPEN